MAFTPWNVASIPHNQEAAKIGAMLLSISSLGTEFTTGTSCKNFTQKASASSLPTFETMGACVLAGPSCDSADVLYEKQPVQLPLGLKSGDRVVIHSCGAYTTTSASIGFNGFPPLDVVVL